MKKTLFIAILTAIITIVSISVVSAQTMYAPDGRQASVHQDDVSSWEAVGWYTYPVTIMYAPDGRTAVISKSAVESWKSVGWYNNKNDILKTLYAPDGRTIKVWPSEVDAYLAVGWYKVPVTTLYALDGRTVIVAESDATAWKKVGWYDKTGYNNAKKLNNFYIGQKVRHFNFVYTRFGIVREIDYSSGKVKVYWNDIEGADKGTAQWFYGLYSETWVDASSISPHY